MAYKRMFNKHVLETIQIRDIFLYSYLRYKFLYSYFIKRGKYDSKHNYFLQMDVCYLISCFYKVVS